MGGVFGGTLKASGGGGPPTGPAGGELAGNYPNPTIASLWETPLNNEQTTAPGTTGEIIAYDSAIAGGSWILANMAGDAVPSMVTAGTLDLDTQSLGGARQLTYIAPEKYGAVGDGVTDDTAAITLAWAAARTRVAAGGRVVFVVTGLYLCSGGVIARTTLADCRISIQGYGSIASGFIHKADANIMIDTHVQDAAYWTNTFYRVRPAPCFGFQVYGAAALSGAIGVHTSIVVGAAYDEIVVEGYTAAKCAGWAIRNDVDAGAVPRWTEETTLGPRCRSFNNFIGLLFDARTGSTSFANTVVENLMVSHPFAGQTAVLIRGTGGVAANLYNALLRVVGNISSSSPSPTQTVVATGGVTDPGGVAANASFSLTVTATLLGVGPGETLGLVNAAGTTTYLVTVATTAVFNPGATSLSLVNGSVAIPAGALAGGSVTIPNGFYGYHAYVGVFTGSLSGTVTSLAFAGGTTLPVYAGQTLLATNTANTAWQLFAVTADAPVASVSISVRAIGANATFAGGTVELANASLTVGQGVSGTDASNIFATDVFWRTESDTPTACYCTCGPVRATTAVIDIAGVWDQTQFGTAYFDTSGSFNFTGRFKTTGIQSSFNIGSPSANATALTSGVFVDVRSGGLRVVEGSNAKQGTATLAAGTVTVANTSVTASSRILLTAQDNNSTGALRVSARTAGTSFVITSSVATDTGVVAYEIFEPG